MRAPEGDRRGCPLLCTGADAGEECTGGARTRGDAGAKSGKGAGRGSWAAVRTAGLMLANS